MEPVIQLSDNWFRGNYTRVSELKTTNPIKNWFTLDKKSIRLFPLIIQAE